MNNTPKLKLELVIRRVPGYLILAGVLLSDSFSAGDLAAMELYGKRHHDGDVTISVKKKQYTPTSKFHGPVDKNSLSEMPTEDVWRRYESTDRTEFGGVIIGRDNFLFDFESPSNTSRMAVISVIADEDNLFNIDSHAILRSFRAVELDDAYEFNLKLDTESVLLEELKGEALMGFYKRPFFTLPDGTPYRLSTDMPALSSSLHHLQYQEILRDGVVSTETHQKMRNEYLSVHNDHDYIDYVIKMGKRQPLLMLKKFTHLLTENEIAAIDKSAKEVLNEEMSL